MRCLVLLCLLLFALPAAALDLSGTYQLKGTAAGQPYRGSLQIEAAGEAWRLRWNRGSPLPGVGLVLDRRTLAVAYGGKDCAVVAYRGRAEGGLDGLWVLPGGGNLGTERATPGVDKTRGLSGDYIVDGTNPDGSVYKGAMFVRSAGPLWRVSWRTLSNAEGFGIERDGQLIVAYGDPACVVAAYRIQPDGSLDGAWSDAEGRSGSEQGRRP